MSACGRAVCKHVHAYVHERPDYVRGLLQPALAFVGAVALPILALIMSHRVRTVRVEQCCLWDHGCFHVRMGHLLFCYVPPSIQAS